MKQVEDRFSSTESFLDQAKTRVVSARQEVAKARDALTFAETKLVLEGDAVRDKEERLLLLRQQATGVPGSKNLPQFPPISCRNWHDCENLFRISSGGETICDQNWQIKPEEVAQRSVLSVSGSFHAPAEQSNDSWGKRPERVINDGDDDRSRRAYDQVWPAVDEFHVSSRDSQYGFRGLRSGRGFSPRPTRLLIRMSGESSLRRVDVSTAPASDGAIRAAVGERARSDVFERERERTGNSKLQHTLNFGNKTPEKLGCLGREATSHIGANHHETSSSSMSGQLHFLSLACRFQGDFLLAG